VYWRSQNRNLPALELSAAILLPVSVSRRVTTLMPELTVGLMAQILCNNCCLGRPQQAFRTGRGASLGTLSQTGLLRCAFALFLLSSPMPACCFGQAPSAKPHEDSAAQEETKEHDDPNAREAWFWRGRRSAPGQHAAELRLHALRKKLEMRAARQVNAQLPGAATQASPLSSPQWVSLGPSPINLNLGGDFGDYGFVVGRVTAIAIDQNDPTGNTVYAGGAYGGLWKSTNAASANPAAVNWTALLDDQPTLAVGAVALKPDNSQVILVGTGEPNNSPETYYGLGILRSADGGATWSLLNSADNGAWSFRGVGFSRIAFSADNTSMAVAASAQTNGDQLGASQPATRPGLYYTLDAGLTWHLATVTDAGLPIAPASATDVVYDRAQHKFFAAMRFHGIYSSPNGINWSRLPAQPGGSAMAEGVCPPARTPSCPMYRATMAVRPGADEMYVWFNDGSSDRGIFQTKDGGNSWTQIVGPGVSSCQGDIAGCITGTQLPYNFTMAAVPAAAGTDLYIGHVNLFKCSLTASNPICQVGSDANGNWLNLTHVYGCTPFGAPAHVHPDQHAIEFASANPNIMYFGNDGGVYRTLNASSGLVSGSCGVSNAFDNLDANFGSMAQFVSFSVHPSDPSTLLGGTQDNGSPAISTAHAGANGVTWQAVATGDGAYNEINPSQPMEWFTAETHVSVSRCALGISCSQAAFQLVIAPPQVDFDESDFYTPYMLDPQNTNSILIGTCRVWRGPSSGVGWSSGRALSLNFDTGTSTVCSDPVTNIVTALAAGGPSTSNGSQVVYAGTAFGNIFVTTNADGGPATWAQTLLTNTHSYPVSSIALDAHDSTGRTAYATVMGFGNGHVFKTADAGSNWTDVTGDLPDAPADSVIVDPNDSNIVYVGTDIGVFQTRDGGTSWVEYGPTSGPGALPAVVVTRLRTFGNQKLRASTYGRGVWEIDLNTFPDFGLAVKEPTSVALFPSQSFTFQGTVSAFNNYSSPIAISCNATTGSLPSTCQGGSVSLGSSPAPFSITVSNPVPADFSFSILGTGSDSNTTMHKQSVQVNVVDFAFAAAVPSTISLPRGTSSQTVGLSVNASGSFAGTVTLSCNGLPVGASCKFTPGSVSPSAGAPATVSLSISTSLSTPAGSSLVPIIGGTSSLLGPVTRSTPFQLTTTLNPQFVVSASPTPLLLRLGQPMATGNVTISPQDGYTGTVSLTCSIAPPGPSCGLAQNSFTSFPATTSLTINANGSPSGRYAITLSGSDGSGTHSLQAPFAITDFALSGPASAAANTGDTLNLSWAAIPISGYTGNLTLTCDATSIGAQTACAVPPALDMSAGFVTGFRVQIKVPPGASPGSYAVAVRASDGVLSRTAQVQIAIVGSSAIQVTGITPQEEQEGGVPVFMTVFGKNFTPQSKVLIDGVDYNSTFFSSSTALGVSTPTQVFNQVGIHQFSVSDPKLGNSNSVPFRIFTPDRANISMLAPPSLSMPVFFGGAVDVAVGDFEKIGRQDMAVLGNQILLLHNAGSGNFTAAGVTSYQGGNTQLILSGDLNRDGNLDLVVVNQSQQAGTDFNANFTVLLGDGQGHFAQSGNFSLPANPFQGALLDLNGDGKVDLLIATSGSGLILLLGNGDGTFGAATTIGPGGDFVLGDVNGKGLTDIIVNGPDQIRILLNNGLGSFKEIDPPELQGLTGKIAAGDFDGDGLLDLFVQGARELSGRAQVFRGLGNGSFAALPEISIAPAGYADLGFSQYSFVVADFDGDGKLDLAGVNGEAHPSHALFLWGRGDGTFTPQVINGPQSFHVTRGDVLGAGLPDLITIGGSLTIIPGQHNRLIASPTILFPFTSPSALSTGDIDGDGFPDIFISPGFCPLGIDCGVTGGEVFLNRGGGVFSAPIDVPVGMRLADLNGDGFADLVGCSGASVLIWPGDGSGTFRSAPISVPIGISCPSDVQIVDMDRDGHLDIVGTGFILYAKSGFSFDLVPIPGQADGPLLVGDFNGDGRLDLIETHAGYILFGQPNRTFQAIFTPGGAVPAGSGASYAVADFDLDGKDDVAVSNSNTIFLFLSVGDGSFIAKSVLTLPGIVQTLTTGDFNGDGIPDLATGLFSGPQDIVIFINDGQANFARSSFASGAAAVSIAAADFNGDGRSDLVYGNNSVNFRPLNLLVMLAGGGPSSIADFTLTRGTSTAQTVLAGDSTMPYDVTFTPLNSTPARIPLVCGGLPPGATCLFSPANPMDTSLGPVLESLTVQTTAGVTPPGTFSFLVQGRLLNFIKPADGPFSLTVTSTQPNLAIAIAPPTAPPAVGNPHSYHLTVSNSGAEAATGVQMQLSFSLAGSVSSATAQQGTCTLGPPVQCSLGSIAVGQSVTVDVIAVFMPDGVSPVSNPNLNVTAVVTERESDAVQLDNTATLVETVGDFQLTATPPTFSVVAGQSASYMLSVAPRFGSFAAPVSLSCASLPAQSTCSFSPASVTPGSSSAPVTLSIATTARSSAMLIPHSRQGIPLFAFFAVALAAFLYPALLPQKRRKQFAVLFPLLVALQLAAMLGACGGGNNSPPPPPPPSGTPSGTYVITVTGKSDDAQRSTQVTLVVQ
jgi:VCBS repeat protein/uncharacterized protein DUF11